jgi:beta-ureidopropionase
MPRKIRIVTSSFATLENTSPPFNIHPPEPEENILLAKEIIESSKSFNPDVIVLPETFKIAGLPGELIFQNAEAIPGPTFNFLAESAKNGRTNIIAGHMVREGGKIFNKAIIIDREGNLAGSYTKQYPVESEINNGVTPGSTTPVFDLDFAKVGVAVCFDLNWPDIWQRFCNENIEIAFWISAYEGGFPLQSYAWKNKYPIVSSVWPYHARVIDINGEIVCSTSRWSRIAYYELNLDRELFHTDMQMDKIAEIQAKYGEDVTLKSFTEEHLFILENNIPGKTIKDFANEFGLITYKEYISNCTEFRKKHI